MSQFIEMFNGEFPMERWEECLTITNGKKYDGEYQETGTYPICGSGGIMGYGEQKLCPKDTVILGRKGNINSPIYMESDYWIVDTAFCLDVDKQKLQPKFFYYWCILFDFTRFNKQGVLPSLTKNDLLKIEIPIPPMDLQTKFVNIQEQADKSEFDVIKSQFIEMFGHAEKTKPLSDFIEVSFPGEWGQEDKDGNGVKVIRTTNFTNTGKLNLADVVTRDIDPNKVEKKKLKKGDIILERSGGTNDNPVGRVVYFNEDGLYLFNNFTQLLRCKEEVNSLFIFYSLFNYYQMNKRIIRSMGNKTTGIQNLKMDQYWQIPIADVSVERQNEFEAIYNQADKSESGCEYRMVS